MSTYTSKIEILIKINELKEEGDFQGAMKLQRVFLDSIKNDQRTGRFSSSVELDRKSKKKKVNLDILGR